MPVWLLTWGESVRKCRFGALADAKSAGFDGGLDWLPDSIPSDGDLSFVFHLGLDRFFVDPASVEDASAGIWGISGSVVCGLELSLSPLFLMV